MICQNYIPSDIPIYHLYMMRPLVFKLQSPRLAHLLAAAKTQFVCHRVAQWRHRRCEALVAPRCELLYPQVDDHHSLSDENFAQQDTQPSVGFTAGCPAVQVPGGRVISKQVSICVEHSSK